MKVNVRDSKTIGQNRQFQFYQNEQSQHGYQKHQANHSQTRNRQPLQIINWYWLWPPQISRRTIKPWAMLLIWLNYPRPLQNISLQFFWRRCRLVIKVQKTQSRQTQKGQKKRRKKNTHSKQLIFNFWFCSSPFSSIHSIIISFQLSFFSFHQSQIYSFKNSN